MKAKEIIGGVLTVAGWGAMLCSVAFYLLFWRVDNEPGAQPVPGLLWAAISCCSLGGLAFLGSQVYLVLKKSWLVFAIAWALCIVLLGGAVTLSPILLLLMV